MTEAYPNTLSAWLRETMRGLLAILAIGALFFLLLASGVVHGYNSLADGLVLNVTMSEGTGTLAADSSTTAANIRLFGATWSPGLLNNSNATTYNGTGAFGSTESDINALDVGSGTAFTVSLIFKLVNGSSCAGDKYLLTKVNNAGGPGWYIYGQGGSCAIKIGLSNTTNANVEVGTPSGYNDGTFHHVVAIRDNTTTVNRGLIYIDNVLTANGTTANGNLSNAIVMAVVAINNGSGGFANATLQLIKMWNRQLNTSEITAVYQNDTQQTNNTFRVQLVDETNENNVTNGTTLVKVLNATNLAGIQTVNTSTGISSFVNRTGTFAVRGGEASTDFPYPRIVETAINGSNAVEYREVWVIPSGADAVLVTFVLNDLTGSFVGGTMKIRKYTGRGLVNISQRAFDIEQKHTAYLLRGESYLLYIDNGAEERNLGTFVPDATATKTITVGNVSLAPLFYQAWKDVLISVNWTNASNGTGTIGFLWNDTLNQTGGIEWFIYNGTNESAQIFYVGSNASVFMSIYTGINNTNTSYLVRWKGVHTRHGVIEGRLLVSFFNMQYRVKLGALATERWHYLVAAMILIIGLAGLFDARSAATGGMVVVGAILLLNFWGWMQTAGIVISTLAILAIVGKLKEGRQ